MTLIRLIDVEHFLYGLAGEANLLADEILPIGILELNKA
jgi:hypothetical protein